MQTNSEMDRLLQQPDGLEDGELAPFAKAPSQPIVRYETKEGAAYYLVGQEENPLRPCALPLQALMSHEWERNEVLIPAQSAAKAAHIALATARLWESLLSRAFPKISFFILGSVDPGEEGIAPSATLRFWAVRPGEPPIGPISSFIQPVFGLEVNPDRTL